MEKSTTITHVDKWGREDVFEKAFTWPLSHQIWHIGREHFPFEKCIPLCVCDANYYVNMNYLLYYEVDSEEMALAAMHAAHHAHKPDRNWFEDFRKRFLMSFEERCHFLVGRKIRFSTVNRIDKLAKNVTKGTIQIVSPASICSDHVSFYAKYNKQQVQLNFSEDFIYQLCVDGIGYETLCENYYRNYFLY